MTDVALRATWSGYCAGCHTDARPLLLLQHGARGLRAWLAGVGPDDRSLSYCCGVCGRVEFVPASEAEDRAYDLTLPRWPDWLNEADPLTLPRRGSQEELASWDGYDSGDDEEWDGVEQDEPVFAVSATDLALGDTRPVLVLAASRAAVPAQRGAVEQRDAQVPLQPLAGHEGVHIEVMPVGRVSITDGPLHHRAA